MIKSIRPMYLKSSKTRLLKTARKVPEVTFVFWITKVLTTGMGETTSDYFVHRVDPVIVVGIAGVCLVLSLVLQFSVRQYTAWIYWLVVVMVSVFGTMAADVLHVGLGVPYMVSTTVFSLALGVVFLTWRAQEKTLSIHSIFTRRREVFYWTTVLATFALGTAAGDMTAVTFHLGYFGSGVMFTLLMAIPAIVYLRFRSHAVPIFWFAYIMTRPLGASFADWLGVPASRGGIGIGTGTVSVALVLLIICFVAYLAVTHADVRDQQITS